MILGAGLGTRLQPLSALRPKPAMPVQGIPLIAYLLEWLTAQGVSEVVLNLHHLPGALRAAAERHVPPGLRILFSEEPRLLDTGGGVRRAAAFLRESDPCLVMAADMILDLPLPPLVAEHAASGSAATLVLLDDPRAARFGTIGIDAAGRVRRIARRLDVGGEERAGVYLSVALLSPRAFEWMPEEEVFGILDPWLGRRVREGGSDVRGSIVEGDACVWEPVGTPVEYLAVNLSPPRLPFFDPRPIALREGTRIEDGLVLGAGAEIEPGAELRRAVVWENERVPADLRAEGGVFAGGHFHSCLERDGRP